MNSRYTYITDELVFEWFGGPYVDVYTDPNQDVPVDIINVWDYEKDQPRIERSARGLAEAVEEWLEYYA